MIKCNDEIVACPECGTEYKRFLLPDERRHRDVCWRTRALRAEYGRYVLSPDEQHRAEDMAIRVLRLKNRPIEDAIDAILLLHKSVFSQRLFRAMEVCSYRALVTYLLQSGMSLALFAIFFPDEEIDDVTEAVQARIVNATDDDDGDELFKSLFER
ncbi:MAG: hypothetical protein AB9919_07885 [Geobacteraceae bacterium]